MKKILAAILTITAVFGNSLVAFAAPETMSDGTVFDAEYYAETNPDVVLELGIDKNALYQHFKIFGQKEGRLPYNPNELLIPEVVSNQTSSLIEPGDENILRLSYLSARWDYYYDWEEDAYWDPDPAKELVRADMRSDPYYQAIRNEIIALMSTQPDAKDIRYYSKYIYNPKTWETEKHYRQVRLNLTIDLIKEGIVKSAYLFENPADGMGYANSCDYDMVTIGYINQDIRNKESLKRHPELNGYY